jgi:hypothetical protein
VFVHSQYDKENPKNLMDEVASTGKTLAVQEGIANPVQIGRDVVLEVGSGTYYFDLNIIANGETYTNTKEPSCTLNCPYGVRTRTKRTSSVYFKVGWWITKMNQLICP